MTCLFGSAGTDLRGPLRAGASDDELFEILGKVWRGRTDRYSELRSEDTQGQSRERIEMYQVGG